MGNLQLSSDMKNISMQQLKKQRLTPAEKFVLDIIMALTPSEPDYLGDVKWYKDGWFFLEQSFVSGNLFVNQISVRRVLRVNQQFS